MMVEGNKGGGPAHQWNADIAAKVTTCAERGVRQSKIAALVEMSTNTMRKVYAKELILADARVQELIGSTQLSVALGRPAKFDDKGNQVQAEIPPNPTMLIFLGKVRLGQQEVQVQEFYDRTADETNASTAGLTESERVGRLAALADRARTRGARRPSPRKRAVGVVPGTADQGIKKQG